MTPLGTFILCISVLLCFPWSIARRPLARTRTPAKAVIDQSYEKRLLPLDRTLEHFGGEYLNIMKQAADVAYEVSVEHRNALSPSICDDPELRVPTKRDLFTMAQSAIICEQDNFARDLVEEWEIWWYRRYRRNPFDIRTKEDRFLAYVLWRRAEIMDPLLEEGVFDNRLVEAYQGAAPFLEESVDTNNPIKRKAPNSELLAPETQLDCLDSPFFMSPQDLATQETARFLSLSELKVCSTPDFGNSTLEILYEIAVSSIACPVKYLAPKYAHKWEEWYNKKIDRVQLYDQTNSDRMFVYVLMRIWGQIPVSFEDVQFEDSLATEYIAESRLPGLVIKSADVGQGQ